MGNKRVTIQNLKVVGVRLDDGVLLVKGAVPGAKNGYVVVHPAIKSNPVG
jgi:large subunit ribosomal protein L3